MINSYLIILSKTFPRDRSSSVFYNDVRLPITKMCITINAQGEEEITISLPANRTSISVMDDEQLDTLTRIINDNESSDRQDNTPQ